VGLKLKTFLGKYSTKNRNNTLFIKEVKFYIQFVKLLKIF